VEQAISDAVIAELAEVGFGRLSFEGVAERAGTGKSPLYRRWPDTTSLVIDTLERLGSDPAEYKRTGVLRDDLIGLTVHMIKAQKGVRGDAYRSLLGEAHRQPELLARFKAQVFDPRFEALTELLQDAAKRGEISPERLTPVVLEVLHALIIKRTLLDSRDPTKKDIAEMVDEALLPLLGYETPRALRHDGDGPLAGPYQPDGERARDPVPGLGGGPDHDGVGADLPRDPVQLSQRVTAGGHEGDGYASLPGEFLGLIAEVGGGLLEGLGARDAKQGGGAGVGDAHLRG
jgi:AcrR family transcriptional regulator